MFLWGHGSWTDLHRHHCVQLVMGVDKTLLCERRPPSIDHRVKRVLRDLPSRLAETGAVSLDAVAASVGLSPSRFLHLFTRSVGVPLRPYVLWLRLQCGPVSSGAASPSPRRRTRPASPMRPTSPAHFVG